MHTGINKIIVTKSVFNADLQFNLISDTVLSDLTFGNFNKNFM